MSILVQKIYNTFDGEKSLKSLSALCLDLLSDQQESWPKLWEGYRRLEDVREREVPCRGFSVRLQHNPGRIRSSLAVVSKTDEAERPCFLCLDQLPEAQKGILYRNEYLILCNPIPIFPSHFTVSNIEHHRQTIVEHINTILILMADFGSGWVALYNGPQCGASAPDHLHFQVIPSGRMPIEKDIREKNRLLLKAERDGVLFHRVMNLGREAILLEGNDPLAVENGFENYLNELKRVLLIDKEPMINMAGWHEEGRWSLVIFPRRKHRPEAFFKSGEERLVISPGVIDMGGILITPVEKDFEHVDRDSVELIYREVSLEQDKGERAINAMTGCSTRRIPL